MKNIALFILLFFSLNVVAQIELPPVTNADTNKYLQYLPTGWGMGSGASGIAGSGVANQVAFWDGTSSVTGEADLTWNPSTNVLSVQGAAPIIESYRASSGAAYFQLRNTSNTWAWYANGTASGMEPAVADGNFYIRNLANTELFRFTTHATTSSSVLGVAGRLNVGQAVGSSLLGWVSIGANTTTIPSMTFDTTGALVSTPVAGYLEAAGQRLYYTNSTGRQTLAHLSDFTGYAALAGATFTGDVIVPAEAYSSSWNGSNEVPTKNDIYDAIQSSDWSNTVTQSGSDTLLNAAAGYGHFQRIGNVVSFTLRVEIALTSAGDANTVYIDPPIASNFTTAASDVIGTATMDPQTLSGANTQRQRCLVFASDSDDKIGVSFDPVASLTYPENRMHISVSGSYIIQ